MHRLRVAVCVLVLGGLPEVVHSQDWTTPDGFLAIRLPDQVELVEQTPPQPEILAMWVAADQSMSLIVVKFGIPANIKIDQAAVEQGFSKELGGEVTRLPTRTINGHEVWDMRGQASVGEVFQLLTRDGDAAYKVMIFNYGGRADPTTIDHIRASVRINRPYTKPAATPLIDTNGRIDVHRLTDISAMIGAFALYAALIVFGVSWLFRKLRPAKSSTD